MTLNILLADDSVPAQNMGKKILIDAGYHVQTVSNGLEALRRIADFVPDMVILDIFMPGYTGLEVCERLRASAATASLPVILTVGKLEPYRPEDGEHVHSNAVIVKPFAAAELISAVRSLIGAAPLEPAEASPEVAVESQALDTSADPLQEVSFATAEGASPEPLALDHLASPAEPSARPSQEQGPDEPLFSYDQSAAPEDAAPQATQELSAYGVEPLLSNFDSIGPESLVFDPDAGATPFSASVTDLLPSAVHPSAGSEASAFAEFDLEAEAPNYYPSAPELEVSAVKESSFSAAAAGQSGFVADTGWTTSKPQMLTPAFSVAPEAAASGSVEVESPTLDVSALDSLLEEEQTTVPAGILESSVLEVGELPEQLFSAPAAEAETASVEPTPEEQARRSAFEALFNSDEAFPVEEFSAPVAGISLDTLPNMAELSKDLPYHVTPDSEIESVIEDSPSEFITHDLDPFLMQDEETMSAASTIPDRDLLMDDAAPTNWQGIYSAEAPSEAMPATPLEAAPVEAPHASVEADPAVPETLDKWTAPASAQIAEIEEPAFSAATIAQQTAPEIVYSEAIQAVPQPEPLEPQSHIAEPEPVQEPEPEPEPVQELELTPEPEPVQELELTPEPEPVQELELTPEPELPELMPAELAEPEPLMPAAEISSFSESVPSRSETDRVEQAVDRVFNRFKRLLVAAIVRELARDK